MIHFFYWFPRTSSLHVPFWDYECPGLALTRGNKTSFTIREPPRFLVRAYRSRRPGSNHGYLPFSPLREDHTSVNSGLSESRSTGIILRSATSSSVRQPDHTGHPDSVPVRGVQRHPAVVARFGATGNTGCNGIDSKASQIRPGFPGGVDLVGAWGSWA